MKRERTKRSLSYPVILFLYQWAALCSSSCSCPFMTSSQICDISGFSSGYLMLDNWSTWYIPFILAALV